MPEAVSVAVAKGVTSQLAVAELSQAFAPERSYADWDIQLEELDSLRVDVVAVQTEQQAERNSRGSMAYQIPIDVAVRKRFGGGAERVPLDEIDALVLLVEEIYESFELRRLADFDAAAFVEAKVIVNPDKAALRGLRQFTGIVRLTFEATKAV